MAICKLCSSAVKQLWPEAKSESRPIHVSYPIYQPKAVEQCWICYRIEEWLELQHPQLLESWRTRQLDLQFRHFGNLISDRPDTVLLPVLFDIVPVGHSGYEEVCEVELIFIPAEESVDHPIVTPNCSQSHDIDIKLVKSWVDECVNSHEKCRGKPGKPWYPTRLLYLGSTTQDVKLVLTKDSNPNGPYMTLSHRWGKKPYVKLESSTLTQLQRAVDVPSLPQAFQNAIAVTHQLGINYIWIDSLCIMQDTDDLSDWDVESQTMHLVYYHSYLNISATKSVDGSEPLFEMSPWEGDPFFDLELEVDGVVKRFIALDNEIWTEEVDDAPLNQRGWVFQERFLARRALHFGEFQMAWECNQLTAMEMIPKGLPRTAVMSHTNKVSQQKTTEALQEQHANDSTTGFNGLWQSIATAYSACQFTFNKDKLRAFAGIANSIMNSTGDQYAAGMWKSTILYDLPWYLAPTVADVPATRIPHIPSWSWASVEAEVLFPPATEGFRREFAILQDFPHRPATTATINNSDPGVDSISLRGVCLQLNLGWDGQKVTVLEVAQFQFPVTDTMRGALVSLDRTPQSIQESILKGESCFMPIFMTRYTLYGILLEETRDTGVHIRVGAVEIELMTKMRPKVNQEAGWIELPRDSNDEFSKNIWSKEALGLIEHVAKCNPRVVRII